MKRQGTADSMKSNKLDISPLLGICSQKWEVPTLTMWFIRYMNKKRLDTVAEPSLDTSDHFNDNYAPVKARTRGALNIDTDENFTINRNGPPKSKTLRDQAFTVTPNNAKLPILGESGDTKYDLPLRIKNKVSTYKDVLPRCPTLQAWDKQNELKFGFNP